MVRSKKEQEAFETQLWKEEAGELICIQKGLKHIRKNGFGNCQKVIFSDKGFIRRFQRQIKKAKIEFENAKTLARKIWQDIENIRNHRNILRESQHDLDLLETTFVKKIDYIVDFLEKVGDGETCEIEKSIMGNTYMIKHKPIHGLIRERIIPGTFTFLYPNKYRDFLNFVESLEKQIIVLLSANKNMRSK